MTESLEASDEHFAFFKTATPIGRDLFVETYQDVARISQLLMAPLGAGYRASATNVIRPDSALEEYTKVFRQWEEVISRSVYFAKGIPEDRMAASMHLFLEIKKDADVLKAIREEATNVSAILEQPSVVPMVPPMLLDKNSLQQYEATKKNCDMTDPNMIFEVDRDTAWLLADSTAFDEKCELNFNTPGITALLIKQVLLAISDIFDSIDEDQTSLPSFWNKKYKGRGSPTPLAARDVVTHRCGFSPHDLLLVKMKGHDSETCRMQGGLPSAIVRALLRCLDVEVPGGEVRVSVAQYHALIDAYGQSKQVKHTLKVLLDLKDQEDKGSSLSLLDSARIGASAGALETRIAATHSLRQKQGKLEQLGRAKGALLFSATASPLVSELTQLSCLPAHEAGPGGEGKGTLHPATVLTICNHLMYAQDEAAQSASSIAARKLLENALSKATKAMQGLEDPWKEEKEKEEDEDEDDGEESVEADYDQQEMLSALNGALPDPLFHSLLVDCAKYYVTYYQSLMADMQFASSFPEDEEDDPTLSLPPDRVLIL